jgi:hypothetical protein
MSPVYQTDLAFGVCGEIRREEQPGVSSQGVSCVSTRTRRQRRDHCIFAPLRGAPLSLIEAVENPRISFGGTALGRIARFV